MWHRMCGSELLFGAGLIGTVILFLCTTARGYPFLIHYTVTYQEKNCYPVIPAASKSATGVTWIWRYALIRVYCTMYTTTRGLIVMRDLHAVLFLQFIFPLSDLIFIPKLIFRALTYMVSTSKRCFRMSS